MNYVELSLKENFNTNSVSGCNFKFLFMAHEQICDWRLKKTGLNWVARTNKGEHNYLDDFIQHISSK